VAEARPAAVTGTCLIRKPNCEPLRTDSTRPPKSYCWNEEKTGSHRARKEDHFRREKGDAEAALDGVSPQKPGRPGRGTPQSTRCSFDRRVINLVLVHPRLRRRIAG